MLVGEDVVWRLAERANGLRIRSMDKFFGYARLCEEVSKGRFSLENVGILIIVLGRADILSRHHTFEAAFHRTVALIHEKKRDLMILVSSPLPRWDDSQRLVDRLDSLSGFITRVCDDFPWYLEYVGMSYRFYQDVQQRLMDRTGITESGASFLQNEIWDKIERAKLWERWSRL